MNRTVLALTASLLFALSACGGGGPSTEEIADGLAGSGFNESQALCVAEKIKDLGLSDERLEEMATGDDTVLTSEEMEIFNSVDISECM